MAVFVCPNCSHTQDAPDEYVGRIAKCLKCETQSEIPKSKPKPHPPAPPSREPPQFKLPPVEPSGVAISLTVVAVLEIIVAPGAGLVVGVDNPLAGWLIFLSGVVSGLMLFGFACVIENTTQSAQRLGRIEMLIQKEHDDKKAG